MGMTKNYDHSKPFRLKLFCIKNRFSLKFLTGFHCNSEARFSFAEMRFIKLALVRWNCFFSKFLYSHWCYSVGSEGQVGFEADTKKHPFRDLLNLEVNSCHQLLAVQFYSSPLCHPGRYPCFGTYCSTQLVGYLILKAEGKNINREVFLCHINTLTFCVVLNSHLHVFNI